MATLLIAFDGSEPAATAVRAAAGLFAGARTLVATVAPDPAVRVSAAIASLAPVAPSAVEQTYEGIAAEGRRQAAETAAGGVAQARSLGLEAEAVDVHPSGPSWVSLVEAAHRLDADVIVCGTRGRGLFARSLLGSTSSSLLHNSDVPLLVVPDGTLTADGPLVAAYDGSPGATHAIEVAGRIMPGRPTLVVHAWEPVFHRGLVANALAGGAVDELAFTVTRLDDAVAGQAEAKAAEGVAAARTAGLEATGLSVEAEDGAWRAVAATAREHGAAAIVLGTRGLGSARSVLLGSVSSGLVQNAERPVLVVPAAVSP